MEYQWVGMSNIPPECSTVPLPRDEYVKDMDLRGEKLTRQVRVDTPRTSVFLQNIRIRSGLVLEEFVRHVLDDARVADAVLALSTQAVYAAPLRSLSVCLAPKDLFLAECENRQPSVITIEIEHDWAKVVCEKDLQMVRPLNTGTKIMRNVTVTVEYDSREPYVVVGLRSRPKK